MARAISFCVAYLLFSTPLILALPSVPRQLCHRASDNKHVIAHHMVGNTYPYTLSNWQSDVSLAHSKCLDAFALNMGSDSWQPDRVADAYNAAQQSNTGFKLFLSLDMSSLPCSTADHAKALRNLTTTFISRPSQLIYNGHAVVSTFAGEACTFGQANSQSGWDTQFANHPDLKGKIYFMPSFFVAPNQISQYSNVLDGYFNWNAGWPTSLTSSDAGNAENDLNTFVYSMQADKSFLDVLNSMSPGRGYMAPVSPWFFTHYGPNSFNKNWIYLADWHLYNKRWQTLIANRTQFDFVQLLTWNDYGESHYVGPIEGAQPNSQAWVNGFDHTGWLSMACYYATAFKTGTYPPITSDQIYMWSRPHAAKATASNDPVARPTNADLTQDRVWVVVMATQASKAVLSTDSTLAQKQTFDAPAGVTLLSVPITPGGIMYGEIQRGGNTVVKLQPQGFVFNGSPVTYNFNALVASAST
ncbi:glycoside hydrolase family 71 protein [Amanita muscaria Koide BX008]|uniref:Glycoside hydrolase family 71 protein n=1 Tax=Amanita muscaria (strain Koide BX008) TaxID=946122 RepID=A0A0C2X242_AMAMK|nr:glycoside hydrolase family 71 protein [Amanita muscaria Koide BX008]